MTKTQATAEDLALLDPFNLRDLVQDTDRRIFGIVTHDYEKVTPETALNAVKSRLREAAAPMAIEMMNDVQELQGRLGITDIVNTGRRLPDPMIMAERISGIFAPPPNDDQALRQWAVRRVQWAFDLWLHLSATLLHRVAADTPIAIEVSEDEGTVRVPRPRELEAFGSGWGLVARAMGEYLAAKGELLRAYGHPAPHLTITFDRGESRAVSDALESFWSDRAYAPYLALQAMRGALIEALGVGCDAATNLDLRRFLTSDLVGLAASAGLPLPFTIDLLGNLTAELEYYTARCEAPPVMILFPCVRILVRAAEIIARTPADAAVAERAVALVLGNPVQEGGTVVSEEGGKQSG